ncbi:MAG: hypothetical protein Tsb0016_06510 [Sphingomonadales bacterium]
MTEPNSPKRPTRPALLALIAGIAILAGAVVFYWQVAGPAPDQQGEDGVGQAAAEATSDASTAAAIAQAEDFLAANAQREGIVTTASGLQYEIIEAGDGAQPGPYDRVSVHYTGQLTDETVFDSSRERGEPASFSVDGVIAGWTEALQLMREGARWRLYIPPALAYGANQVGQIPPHAVLIFDVELLGVAAAPPNNEQVAALIDTPLPTPECGPAPSLEGAPDADAAALAKLHQDGNAWQDCMSFYLRDAIQRFEAKARAMRQIDPDTVPGPQKRAVNAYFRNAVTAVSVAEAELNAFDGIPAP